MASRAKGKRTTIIKAGDPYYDCRPFNLLFTTDDIRMKNAVQAFLRQFTTIKGRQSLLQLHAEVLLTNLARVQRDSSSTWLRYHQGHDYWSGHATAWAGNPMGVSHKVTELVKALVDRGWLEHYTGHNRRKKGDKRFPALSRFRAKAPMQAFLLQHGLLDLPYIKHLNSPNISFRLTPNTTYPRGKPKRPPKMPKKIKASLDFINVYNNYIQQQIITILTPNHGIPLDECFVYRVFNRNSYQSLGRLYGAWWMQASKVIRLQTLINGEPVIELDYSGMHPCMLYAMEGLAAPNGDIYDIPVVPRVVVKLALMMMINAKSIKTAYKALVDELSRSIEDIEVEGEYDYGDGISTIDRTSLKKYQRDYLSTEEEFTTRLVNPILAKHAAIAKHLMSDKGITLQRIDSEICLEVLNAMTNANIPCLSIHDSFIVPAIHEQSLRLAMEQAYVSVLNNYHYKGETPIIKSAVAKGE